MRGIRSLNSLPVSPVFFRFGLDRVSVRTETFLVALLHMFEKQSRTLP